MRVDFQRLLEEVERLLVTSPLRFEQTEMAERFKPGRLAGQYLRVAMCGALEVTGLMKRHALPQDLRDGTHCPPLFLQGFSARMFKLIGTPL